jgi:UDP-glucose 4-epimerase
MECLVTGGSGFIGQYIVRQLAQEGHNVIVFDVVKPDYALPENVEFIEGDTRYYANLFDVCVDGIDEIFDVAGVLGTHELLYDNNRASGSA